MGERYASFRRMWAVVLSTALVLSLPAYRMAWAQAPDDAARAVQLRKEGVALGAQGLWHEAHARLTEAAALDAQPATLHHLAKAHMALSQWVDALETYRRLLEQASLSTAQPFVLEARARVTELEAKVSKLKIVIQPSDALGEVATVDGVRLTEDQLEDGYLVNAGLHVIRVEALDHDTTQRDVMTPAGETAVVTVVLAPSKKPVRALAPVLPPTPDASSRSAEDWITIGAIGGGSASLAAGGTIGLFAILQAAGAEEGQTLEADAAKDKAIVADFFGAVGVIGIGVGIVMLLNSGAAASPATGTRDGFVLRF